MQLEPRRKDSRQNRRGHLRRLHGLPRRKRVRRLTRSLRDGVEFRYADLGMVYDSYFETTLMSALLRTFDAVEVRHPGIDEKFEAKLRVADPVRSYAGAVAELAYAAIRGKVPKKTIRATLEKFQGMDRWFRMLLAIMNAVEAR